MRWLAFLSLILASAGVFAAEIKAVRTWAEPARTRVVFDVTEAVDFKVFTMRKPDRVVIDFKQTRARGALRLPSADGPTLKRLRHARRGESGHRVVLDLNNAVKVTSNLLAPNQQYGYRVVLDLNGRARKPAADGARSDNKGKSLADRADKLAAATPPVRAPVTAAPATDKTTTAAPAADKPTAPLRQVVVAIDAGHGGADVGAIGPSGVYEKDITLAVARELAAAINDHPHMRAILTRQGDRYLKLRERMDRARHKRADLFVSIHADAFRDSRVKGSSVYVLSQRGASSEAAKWLADHENASDLIGGVSLEDKDDVLKSVLIDLSQTASIESSIVAGKAVLDGLRKLGPVHKKKVQHAGFMVLKSPDIPSILIETAFISNPTEEKRLRSKAFRKRLAGAIYSGIHDYFASNPPPDTRFAQNNRSHKVSRGDTLSGIANRYAVSVNSIKLANNMAGETVRTGEVLTIP